MKVCASTLPVGEVCRPAKPFTHSGLLGPWLVQTRCCCMHTSTSAPACRTSSPAPTRAWAADAARASIWSTPCGPAEQLVLLRWLGSQAADGDGATWHPECTDPSQHQEPRGSTQAPAPCATPPALAHPRGETRTVQHRA
jgi:hypothetical protein